MSGEVVGVLSFYRWFAVRNGGDRGLEPSERAFWREEADALREILTGDS